MVSVCNNESIIKLIKYALPEVEETLILRYQILNAIRTSQPVGRRVLSLKINQTERVVRRECNVLKESNLIDFSTDGMRITSKGEEVLVILAKLVSDLNGLSELEDQLARKLNIKKTIIGAIGLENEDLILSEVGCEAARYLSEILEPNMILGLTGGSSIAKVISGYKTEWSNFNKNDITVVPARGGVGVRSMYQGNTLVEELAVKIDADYRVLYTQDNLSASTIEELKNEPTIRNTTEKIDRMDVLIFGIGRADVMAKRRFLIHDEIEEITRKGAVAEAFGYYFNESGEIVHEISTIGIDLNKYKELKNVIAVASGKDKIEAIMSISKLNKELVLVTDEATAKTIIEK